MASTADDARGVDPRDAAAEVGGRPGRGRDRADPDRRPTSLAAEQTQRAVTARARRRARRASSSARSRDGDGRRDAAACLEPVADERSVHVRLRVGGERYALPIDERARGRRARRARAVPGAGAAVLGVRNLRGRCCRSSTSRACSRSRGDAATAARRRRRAGGPPRRAGGRRGHRRRRARGRRRADRGASTSAARSSRTGSSSAIVDVERLFGSLERAGGMSEPDASSWRSSATRRAGASTASSTRCWRSRAAAPRPTPSTRSSATRTRSRAPRAWSGSTEISAPRARHGGRCSTDARQRGCVATRADRSAAARRGRAAPCTSRAADEPNVELIAELDAPRRGGRQRRPARRSTSRRPPPRRRRREPLDPRPRGEDRPLLDLVGETVLHRRRLEHALGARTTAEAEALADELDAGERLLGDLKDAAIGMRTLPLSPRSRRRSRAPCATSPPRRASRSSSSSSGAETRARPRDPRGPLRAARPHPPQRGRARDRDARGARARRQAAARAPRAARRAARRHGRGHDRRRRPRGLPRRRSPRRAGRGSLADIAHAAGLLDRRRGQRHLRAAASGSTRSRTQVEAFGGSIEVRERAQRRGTQVILRLPLALALIDVLLVERGRQRLGFPLASVEEAVVARRDALARRARPRSSCAAGRSPLARPRGARWAPPAPTAGARRGAVVVLAASGRRVARHLRRPARRGGGRGQVASGRCSPPLVDVPRRRDPRRRPRSRCSSTRPCSCARSAGSRAARAPCGRRRSERARRCSSSRTRSRCASCSAASSRRPGYRVQTARDGRDALTPHRTRDADIDLVVTDVEMPEMDGIELDRADPRPRAPCSALPVVIVTSLRRGRRPQARASTPARTPTWSSASFDQHDLLETVERLVGR